jgi:hypothetical protein
VKLEKGIVLISAVCVTASSLNGCGSVIFYLYSITIIRPMEADVQTKLLAATRIL